MTDHLPEFQWGKMQTLSMRKMETTFPVDCFPPIIGNYVKAVAKHTQTSIDMAAVVALGILAVCNQNKFIVVNNYPEPLNLYTLIVAEPGERKSAVMQHFTNILASYQRDENQSKQEEINRCSVEKEILEQQLRRMKEKKGEVDDSHRDSLLELTDELQTLPEIRPLRLMTDDCSPEALVDLLHKNNGSMSVISAEGGIFDIMAGRYSNGINLDVFLKGHSGDEIQVDRKGSDSLFIQKPALTFVVSVQPDVLHEMMSNRNFAGRGLLARFLYSVPVSTVGSREYTSEPLPVQDFLAYKELIYQLLDNPSFFPPKELNISSEGIELVKDYFYKVETMLMQEVAMKNWLSKHIGTMLRIAGNLHLASEERNSLTISAEIIRKAIKISKYFGSHARYTFVAMRGQEEFNKAQDILSVIYQNKGNLPLTRREIYRLGGNRGLHSMEEMSPYLELLEEYGYIHLFTQPPQGRGRPKNLIFLNPDYIP